MSVKQITTGQDSFLDIVANLVGILIILVVVVGAQASASWVVAKPKPELTDNVESLGAELSQTSDVVTKLQIDNEQLEHQIVRENQLAARLTDQRHEMLMQLKVVKDQIARQKQRIQSEMAAVDSKAEQALRQQSDFLERKSELERELGSVQRAFHAVSVSQPKSLVIEHFPNPIAKTVFSEEVHFRLADGKLSYVPMDELIARMKSEWKVKAEKLKRANRTLETVGPIANYRMQYELAAETVRQETKVGPISSKAVRFKQFQLLPLSDSFGETVEQALANGSQFRRVLGRHEARKTTVSIWVYPESFEDHNSVKSWLHENGFQMASWPLDSGNRISGGPNGFKTSAQ